MFKNSCNVWSACGITSKGALNKVVGWVNGWVFKNSCNVWNACGIIFKGALNKVVGWLNEWVLVAGRGKYVAMECSWHINEGALKLGVF